MRSLSNIPFYKIYVSIAAFVLVILSSTIGYMVIEDYTLLEAFYMTMITISTVGFTEVKPLNDAGRIFTSVVILVNISTFTYFITQLSSYFLDGEFTRTYKTLQMKKAINLLDGHIIICGFGRNGKEAARLFHQNGKDFVIIESHATRKDDLPFPIEHFIENDATRDETLIEAGIYRASALLTTLPEDADNLYVVLTAHDLNPKLKIISRASNDSSVRKLKTAGADNVIMPDKIGGAHMATLALSPDVEEFVDLMAVQRSEHFNIVELDVKIKISLAELDCWKKSGATILGVKNPDGEFAINPVGSTLLAPGSRIIAMGSKEQLDKAAKLLE